MMNQIFILFYLFPISLFSQVSYTEKEALKVHGFLKAQYHGINEVIQEGAKLELIRKEVGIEECQEMAKPYINSYMELKGKIDAQKGQIFSFLKTATNLSSHCLTCDSIDFDKKCKLIDRGLEIAKGAFGQRRGERIYDTSKYTDRGFKKTVFSPTKNKPVTPRTLTKINSKKSQSKIESTKKEELVSFEKVKEVLKSKEAIGFSENYKYKMEDISKNQSQNLFRIISSRYMKKWRTLFLEKTHIYK